MLEKVKTALRVTTTAYDENIEGIIAAAKADLKLAGICNDEKKPLVSEAIILYARATFSRGEIKESFMQTYELLKARLGLSQVHAEREAEG